MEKKDLFNLFKFENTCICCGKKFETEDIFRSVCDECLKEFADIVVKSYEYEFEKED